MHYPSNPYKPLANIAFQATPLHQSTPLLDKHIITMKYTLRNHRCLYTPTNATTTTTPNEPKANVPTNIQNRLGQPRKNPIVEQRQQRAENQTSNFKTDNLRFPKAITPRSNIPKSFFHQSIY